jgi:Domain of unknown function DUF29
MREGTLAVDRSYDSDLALWAADQACALRRAAKASTNQLIDWENVAEEIESLGKVQGVSWPAASKPSCFT